MTITIRTTVATVLLTTAILFAVAFILAEITEKHFEELSRPKPDPLLTDKPVLLIIPRWHYKGFWFDEYHAIHSYPSRRDTMYQVKFWNLSKHVFTDCCLPGDSLRTYGGK
jgi:hypothetical protein